MCLLLIAVDTVPDTPLLLLGNRDEFHGRATADARPWAEDDRVVGGRDLVARGSWLAARSDGRFAAVTNLRTGLPATAPRSRGWLVRDFVLGNAGARDYLDALDAEVENYGPFNLVVGDRHGAWVRGTANEAARRLDAGVHVISNGPIGVHWPKTERLQQRFLAAAASAGGVPSDAQLLDLLADEQRPVDEALPRTGVGLELERVLSPIFIRGDKYGTRASSLVSCGADGRVALDERRFGPNGAALGESRWQSDAADARFDQQ
jgi:uncharacterized protein with NRDE domain